MEEKQDSSRVAKERTNFKKEQLITRVTGYREVREKNRTTNIGFGNFVSSKMMTVN